MIKKIKKNLKKIVSCMVLGTIGMSILPVESVQALNRDGDKENIINQYIKGVKMLPEQIEARKEKARELGLEKYVDDRYFLIDDYYDGRSEADINEIGANILVDTVTENDLEAWSSNLMQGIDPRTVTRYEMVSAGGSTVGKYEVNGKMAFCAQHSATSPAKGSSTSNVRLVTKETVRKVLYYGYGGPKQLWDMKGNYGWVMTSLGLSYANTGSGGPKAKAFVNRVSKMASPPSGFKVFFVDTNGGRTQDLAYWNYSPKGTLQIEKSSTDTSITNGNNCYSLEGAVYGVYKNSNATNKVAELKTDSNGKSNTVSLDEGTYYIKEIKSPKGYALDTKIYSIKVNSDKKSIGRYKDRPQTDPVGIVLKKVDSENGTNRPQGSGALENAEFTFKFYEGSYGENVNPEKLGKKPTRIWVLKTDKYGYAELNDNYKISGDKFYYSTFGVPVLPLGTLTMQETKAPRGYKINHEIFVRKITSNGTADNVNTYNVPIVKEEVIKGQVKIIKVDEETGEKLEGAKFEVKDKKTGKVVETLTTDKNGEAMTNLYPFGTELIFKEIKAPNKYVLDGKEYFATITDKQQTIELTVTNRIIKGSISIHKIDKETKEPLQGVEFDVLDINEKVVDHLVTDENGNAKSKDLKYGEYKFVETRGLDGYLIDNTPIKVNITENKEYNFTIENEVKPRPFKIKVIKVNEKNTALEGAEFTVYSDKDCKNEIGKAISNSNGELSFENLKVGVKYYLKETKAPVGYRIPVDSNGKPHVYEVVVTKNNWVTGEFITTIDGKEYNQNSTSGDIHVEGNMKDRVISIQVVNYTSMKLPATGSKAMIPLIVVGISLIGVSFLLLKKVNRKGNRG
ncbi:LPXTG cell wall anchor domain-containing protein [Clostridium sardiniense]|uniref:LPXTG cell wall anchor domain-containing protein n=1 Tax=Clostridium sardiniense TaxID=29369 RepID=A0ABS7KZS8_CLOSR|nr:SpaA isopeptide-forming pilin-related protein [Clostridium sardiniense]MBY0756316.1 LPXTG cell wall anchor domain-containing protein [Clostridium sardiniense]MDQ0461472.1 LPXTG-motif cell wall-anchored protein [Clostridium sardiniense]